MTVLSVVGNKEDLVEQESVDMVQAKEWASQKGALYAKTSAKTGQGVEELFRHIAIKLTREREGHSVFVRSSVRLSETRPSPPDNCKC